MRGIRLVDLLANIRANIVAFFSIAMFVCLGIGLFLGVGWGAEALYRAGQDAIESGKMYDIELQFPFGVTESDLEQIKAIDGVSQVETGYSCMVLMEDGNTDYVLKVESMTDDMNLLTPVTGTLPRKGGEVALLSFWAQAQGVKVGDRITLRHDGSDGDKMRFLTADTFKVTALVDSPKYLLRNSLALGISDLGLGGIDCVGFVTRDSFDAGAYSGGFSNVYLRCSSLEGTSTFSREYRERITPIVGAIEDLGATLAPAQYQKVHDEAQERLSGVQGEVDDAEKRLGEGERQLDEGERQVEEGRKTIEEGERQLVKGVESSTDEQEEARQRLDDAYRQLSDKQAQYDAAVRQYNTALDDLDQNSATFDSVRNEYDELVSAASAAEEYLGRLEPELDDLRRARDAYAADATEARWAEVVDAYTVVRDDFAGLGDELGNVQRSSDPVSSTLGLPLQLDARDVEDLPEQIDPQTVEGTIDEIEEEVRTARRTLELLDNTQVKMGGTSIPLMGIPAGIQGLYDTLAETADTLDSSRELLEAGWSEYNDGKAQYDAGVKEGKATLDQKSKELEEGRATLDQKSKELEEGRATLEQKSKELEEGKEKLETAKSEFAKIEEYEWVVTPRQDCGGAISMRDVAGMMHSVRWAMALLFVLVGLFVCYSALSRLVHEQVIQIGTKKAMGFREHEIAAHYLAFAGMAVLIGVVLSVLVAVFVVQFIMNPVAGRQYSVGQYPPYFDLRDVLVMGSIEMVLILLSTWLAIHGLLKRNAIDLLSGESAPRAKERFYERTKMWKRMSLFSQTVVNNCANDVRRVVGTLVGVIGCTALIVTAVTLAGNVALSLTRQYEEVYAFDSVACLDGDAQEVAKSMAMALYDEGAFSSPAFMRQLQARKADGSRLVVKLVVPTNEETFRNLYRVVSTSGEQADVEGGGLWVNAAYAEHVGVSPGDSLTLTENTGKTHTFKVAGVFDYFLLRQEFVMSMETYREAFGVTPSANVLLVDKNEKSLDELRDALVGVEGYLSLVDDYKDVSYGFGQIADLLNIVVAIYLGLSAAMAVMVLLNLDVMFVGEKKRELIVLMICGFSTRQAKAYIYRDSIVLTIVGIAFGIVLGAVMGSITVAALEPDMGHFVKDFYVPAAVVGGVGAAVFAGAVLLWSLRRIPRFDLTDISRV